MKLVQRNGIWQVHFEGPDGSRIRTSTKVKVNPALPDAGKARANLAALDIMRAALLPGSGQAERERAPRGLTLAHILRRTLDEHWEHQKSNREKRYLVGRLIRDVGYWPIRSITYTMLDEYGRDLAERGDAPATRNRKMSAIHTALGLALKRGEVDSIPPFPHWAENNVKERYLGREEEVTLLTSMVDRTAPGDEVGNYLLALVPFLLDTGLRASEVMLDPTQDLGDRVWLKHGSTKSNRGRVVPLTTRARECLTKILRSPYHSELMDLYLKDKTIPSQRLGKAFRLAVSHAGIKGVTLHTLRHTCASRLVQAGVSLYVVKEWLGHSSITITERYAHLAPKNLDAAAAALEPAQAPASAVDQVQALLAQAIKDGKLEALLQAAAGTVGVPPGTVQ